MGLFSSIGSFLTSSVVSNVASTGASLFSAYGTYQAGKDQADAYDYNAAAAQREAAYQEKRTKYLLTQHKNETAKLKGYQKTGMSKAGVRSSTGTPLDVLKDTDAMAAIDAEIIRYGGEIETSSALSEAKMYRSASSSASKAGWMGAGATLLTAPSRWVL